MRILWALGIAAVMSIEGSAQGIRGVTRRTPTLVPGQAASQFFAAGGLTLNPVNPALANVPGAAPGSAAGGRGLVGLPVPVVRPGQFQGPGFVQRPMPPMSQAGGRSPAGVPSSVQRSVTSGGVGR